MLHSVADDVNLYQYQFLLVYDRIFNIVIV